MKRLFPFFRLFFLLVSSSPALRAADLVLVENGVSRAEIVVAETRPRMTTLAAAELRHFIAKMSGARLPIVTVPGAARVKIHVGESAATKQLGVTGEGLRNGAYRIATGPDWLVLLGPDKDFDVAKYPWPLERKDVPRKEAEWRAMTSGKTDAAWGFPFHSGFKAFWQPNDFLKQMSARYGDDFPELWKTTADGKPGMWQHDQSGSLNAVHDVLRRLGARFFMPGELGEVLPKSPTLALAAVDATVRPDFAIRDYVWYNYAGFAYDDIIWARRIGMNSTHETLGPLDGPHGMARVTAAAEMKEKHPDYYALIGGKRDTEHRGFGTPCFSSAGLEAETLRYMRYVYDTFDVPSVDLWPVDGLRLCQCEKCAGKTASELVWGFTDRVARQILLSHPTKRVTGGAYTSYQEPPPSLAKFSPNLSVWIANAARPRMNDEEHWADYTRLIEVWRTRLAPGNLLRVENNRYHIWGDVISHPVLHPRGVARDLKMLKGISSADIGEQSQVNGTWRAIALDHITLYVQSRFLWQADQDVEAVLKDYCTHFYGPVAPQMHDAITFAEQNLAYKDQSRSGGRANVSNVTLAVALKFRDMLDAAQKAAGDTIYGKRVQAIIAELQPREELIAEKQKKEAELAESRAKAPVAKPGTEYRLKDNTAANQPVAVPTTFRVEWEKDALVLNITCHEPQMAKLNIANDVFNGDCVAISVETPLHSYYHIEINPDGGIAQGNPAGDWKSLAEVKATRSADSWHLRVKLPVVSPAEAASDPKHRIAGNKPTAAQPWYFNIGRHRVVDLPKAELQAFSPTKANWHVPGKFGKLVVE
jgi:hypothetical protein